MIEKGTAGPNLEAMGISYKIPENWHKFFPEFPRKSSKPFSNILEDFPWIPDTSAYTFPSWVSTEYTTNQEKYNDTQFVTKAAKSHREFSLTFTAKLYLHATW